MKKNYITLQLQNQDRRRYSRVAFDRSAWLINGQDKKQRFDQVGNLSMGGVSIHGQSSLQTGDTCNLELHDDGHHRCRIVRFCARVVRTRGDSLALEFVDMDVDSYMFLQTVVLYSAEDPLGVVAEFHDNFPRPAVTASC